MTRGLGPWLPVAVAVALLVGCSRQEPAPGSEPVARVGDSVITRAELDRERERLPQALRDRFARPGGEKELIEQLVDRRLLIDEARARGIDREPDVRAKLEDFERRTLVEALRRRAAGQAVSEEAIRRYYDTHPAEYREERVRVRHILVRQREEAADLLAQLKEGAEFPALAREHSIDPTARRGGELGWVARGRMDPAFEAAAFALREPGDLSDVVRTRFGYHVIQLVEAPSVQERPFEQVQALIRQKLERDALDALLRDLRERTEVEILVSEPDPESS